MRYVPSFDALEAHLSLSSLYLVPVATQPIQPVPVIIQPTNTPLPSNPGGAVVNPRLSITPDDGGLLGTPITSPVLPQVNPVNPSEPGDYNTIDYPVPTALGGHSMIIA